MTNEIVIDLEGLKEILIFANTPLYLYKNFRKNEAVQTLAKVYSPEDLIRYFDYNLENATVSFNNLTLAYAMLIALSLKEYDQVISFFNRLDSYSIKWAKELKYIFLKSSIVEQHIEKKIEYLDKGAGLKVAVSTESR